MSIIGERHKTVYRSRHAQARKRRRTAATLALGVTAAVAVIAGIQAVANGATDDRTPAPAAAAAGHTALPSAKPVPRNRAADPAWHPKSSAEVPPGPAVPVAGSGSYRIVPGTSALVGSGPVRTYTVEIEKGVTPPDGDAAFAEAVQTTLGDQRSWIGTGEVAWRRVDSGTPRLRIRLASQESARFRCGYDIPIDVSCHQSGTVYLSAVRWIRGAVAYKGDLASYRQYMVNHEVGHSLGHRHRPCETAGGPAPIMMQQTFSTSNNEINDIIEGHPQGVDIPRDGKVCQPNPWPKP